MHGGGHAGQMKAFNPLELELQTGLNHHVSAEGTNLSPSLEQKVKQHFNLS